MFNLLGSFSFRDYLLDKAREREKRELEAQQLVTVKCKIYTGDETSLGLGVVLGQCHLPLKQFLDDFKNRTSDYSNDVLLNVVIKKKLLSKDYSLQIKFPGFDFLVYQIASAENVSSNLTLLKIPKIKAFEVIKLKSKFLDESELVVGKMFFSYLETVAKGGAKSQTVKVILV